MKFPSDVAVGILSMFSDSDFVLLLNLSNIMIITFIKKGEIVKVHEKRRTSERFVQSLKRIIVSKTVVVMITNRGANEAVLHALANR